MQNALNSKHGSGGEPRKGGRPRKFDGASKVVTVTLPLRTLAQLARIDADRARAIVKAADVATGSFEADASRVEILNVTPDKAVILIGHSERLETIPWMQLVAISSTQHLISVPVGTPIERLELAIGDIVAEMEGERDAEEKRMLERLREQLSSLRRARRMVKAEIILVESSSSDLVHHPPAGPAV